MIDPGLANQETVTVKSVAPDALGVSALAKAHFVREMVSLVPRAARPRLAVNSARAVLRSARPPRSGPHAPRRCRSTRVSPSARRAACLRQAAMAPSARPRVVDDRRRTAAQDQGRVHCGDAGRRRNGLGPARELGGVRISLRSARGVSVASPLTVAFAAGDVARDADVRVRRAR